MFKKYFIWRDQKYFSKYYPEDQDLLYIRNRHKLILDIAWRLIAWLLYSVVSIYLVMVYPNKYLALGCVALLCIIICILIFVLNQDISKLLYPFIITQKGKAITKLDLIRMKIKSPKLFTLIMSDSCHGLCYYTSFSLLDYFKKGTMQFVAIKHTYAIDEFVTEKYRIHVLYVNNGWCFDTISRRQMPIEELYELWEGVLLAEYPYKEIRKKSFDGFSIMVEKRLLRLCKENDCSYFVSWDWLF